MKSFAYLAGLVFPPFLVTGLAIQFLPFPVAALIGGGFAAFYGYFYNELWLTLSE